MDAARQFLLSLDRRHWALMLAILLFMSVNSWRTKTLGDFHVFHTTAERVWHPGLLYLESDGEMPFKYAPPVGVLIAPIGLLPERVAVFSWLLATAVVLLLFVAWARRTYFPGAPFWVTALTIIFVAPFYRHLLALGQCDVFILGLVMWSELLRPKRPVASGAVLALACAFKPPFLLFVAVAFAFREWKRVGGVAIGALAGAGLTIARYGVSGTLDQVRAWRGILAQTTAPMFCAQDNQSVFGLVCRWIATQDTPQFRPIAYSLAALLLLLVVGPAVKIKVSEERRAFLIAAAFYLSASLSPLGWRTNLVGMIPLFFLLFAVMRRGTHPSRWLLVAAPAFNAWFGLLMFDTLGQDTYAKWVEWHTYGIVAVISAVSIAWAAALVPSAQPASSAPSAATPLERAA